MKPNTLKHKLLTTLLASTLFFLLPIILISCIPLFCFRYLVGKIVPLFNPKLGKILTTRNSFYLIEELDKSSKCNITVSCTLEGNIDMKLATETILKNGLEAEFPNGSLIYPELKQYVTTRFGYYFWKMDETFDFSRHFKLYEKCKSDQDRFTDEDVKEIREDLLNKTWNKKKPLWEVIIIRNYYPSGVEHIGPHSLFLMCAHHCMGDGFSALQFLTKRIADNKEQFINAKPEKFEIGKMEMVIYMLKAPFALSYIVANFAIMEWVDYPWRVSERDQQTEKCLTDLSAKIPVSRIREIKERFNVSFSSVIFAIVAGAQREVLLKKNFMIPSFIECFSPFPLPNHPEKLRNYCSGVIIKLPVGESDPIKRLNFCHNDYQNLKKSHVPLFGFLFNMIGGSFFSWIIKSLMKNRSVTTGLSNFPAGKTYINAFGFKGVDCSFCAQRLPGCGGFAVCILSYCDGLRIAPVVSSKMLTKDELRAVTLSFEKQIDSLYQQIV